LAICYPEKRFFLLDSNGKKTRFLFQVKTELGLDNVQPVHARVENFQSPEQIDIVLCRAFAALDRFVAFSADLINQSGKLLAMKGQFPDAEIAVLPPGFTVTGTRELTVPGVEGSRHLIEIRPQPG
jgi:16S rRNA (guanine527-N7)-methyltransferase